MNDEDKKDSDITIKLLLIGNAFVGKTLIVQKFIDNTFSKSTMSTIGVDLQSKIIDINGKKVKYLIWDTAGEDRMKTMTYSYYRGCHVILIVYDVTNQKSFENVTTWVECVDKFAKSNVLRILVGNKTDLEDQRVIRLVRKNPKAKIGLASGSTPEGLYQYLIKRYERNEVSFKDIQFYSLDGMCGLSKDNKNSYAYILTNNFLKKIDAQEKNIIPMEIWNLRVNI